MKEMLTNGEKINLINLINSNLLNLSNIQCLAGIYNLKKIGK